ncbi:MAG: hypothetical protein OEM24_10265, partial [Paracoccaceae bacterium]|nr:hypothetical protein [Paracoccaceae bacterium]
MTYRAPIGFAITMATTLGLAAEAPAGDSGGLTFEGYIELEYLNGATDDTFLVGEVWARYMSPSGLGFDAGLVGFTDFDDSEHALYAALTYSFGGSKVSVGVPRPAYDTFSKFPAVGGMRILELELGTLNHGYAELVYLLGDVDPPLGIRYDGEFGALRVAASAHHFDEATDADAFALALRYDVTSNVALLADWERILPDGNPAITTTRAGTELSFSSWESGLAYFNRNTGTGPHIDGTETWVTYMPTSQISVTATALNTNVFDILGLSMRYERMVGDSEAPRLYGQV